MGAKTYVIRYYINEAAYKTGCAGFVETLVGDRNYVVTWAQNRIKNSVFQFYDIQEK